MKKAEAACAETVNDQLRPELERTVVEVLGTRPDAWLEFAVDEATNSPILLFRYPTTQAAGSRDRVWIPSVSLGQTVGVVVNAEA